MDQSTDEMRRREAGRMSQSPHRSQHYEEDMMSQDPDQIRRRIEETRASMSHTVDSIQARLAPDRLIQEAQDKVREATVGRVEEMAQNAGRRANNWRTNMVESIKQNPIPAAMIGIGLGWLMVESGGDSGQYSRRYSQHGGSQSYRELYGTSAGDMRDFERSGYRMPEDYTAQERSRMERVRSEAAGAAGELQHRASEVADQAREQVEHLGEQAQHLGEQAQHQVEEMREWAEMRAHEAQTSVQQLMRERPLVLGIVALAAGAAVGMALPRTQMEDQMMGPARERVMHQAQETAQETVQKVQHVAEETQRAATETAKEEAKKENLT